MIFFDPKQNESWSTVVFVHDSSLASSDVPTALKLTNTTRSNYRAPPKAATFFACRPGSSDSSFLLQERFHQEIQEEAFQGRLFRQEIDACSSVWNRETGRDVTWLQHDCRRTSIFEARSLLGIEPEPDAAGWYGSATSDSSHWVMIWES